MVVEDKKTKVANYHKNTMEALKELLGSMGIENRKGVYIKNILLDESMKPKQKHTKSYIKMH